MSRVFWVSAKPENYGNQASPGDALKIALNSAYWLSLAFPDIVFAIGDKPNDTDIFQDIIDYHDKYWKQWMAETNLED